MKEEWDDGGRNKMGKEKSIKSKKISFQHIKNFIKMSTFQRFSPVCGVREMDCDVVCKIPNFLARAQSTTRRVSEREFKEAGNDYKGNRRLGMGAWNSNCPAPVEHFFDVSKESFYFALHCQCHGSSMFFFPTQNTEPKSMKAMGREVGGRENRPKYNELGCFCHFFYFSLCASFSHWKIVMCVVYTATL